MTQTGAAASCKFLSRNLNISGFTEDSGVFMSCKELLDNSVDACKKAQFPKYPSIRQNNIELELALVEGNRICIHCRDSGIGIDCKSVSALGQLFESSKIGDASAGGEFGIGLKALMLFSLRDCGEPLRMKLRMSESKVWSLALTFNVADMKPIVGDVVGKRVLLEQWPWVTEFEVNLCATWDRKKEENLLAYVAAYTVWNSEINIITRGLFTSEISHRSPFESWITNYPLQPHEKPINSSTTLAVAQSTEVTSDTVIEMLACLFPSSMDTDEGIVDIIRSRNGTPLLNKEAFSCTISESVREFLKTKGCNFGMDKFYIRGSGGEEDREKLGNLKLISTPIVVTKAEASRWRRMLLAVNITSRNSIFSGFSKSSLLGNPNLGSALVNQLHRVLNQLKQKVPWGFRASIEANRAKVIEVYAPSMASSVAKIILSSRDREFQKKALELLQLQDVTLEYASDITNGSRKRARARTNSGTIEERIMECIREKLEKTSGAENTQKNDQDNAQEDTGGENTGLQDWLFWGDD